MKVYVGFTGNRLLIECKNTALIDNLGLELFIKQQPAANWGTAETLLSCSVLVAFLRHTKSQGPKYVDNRRGRTPTEIPWRYDARSTIIYKVHINGSG